MRTLYTFLFLACLTSYAASAQKSLSKKEQKIEKKRQKKEAFAAYVEAGSFHVSLREVISPNGRVQPTFGGVLWVLQSSSRFDELVWFNQNNESKTYSYEPTISNYTALRTGDDDMLVQFKAIANSDIWDIKIEMQLNKKARVFITKNGTTSTYEGRAKERAYEKK